MDKIDFYIGKVNRSRIRRELTSSGKGGCYGVPSYLKDAVQLVDSVDRNGVQGSILQNSISAEKIFG
jgi:hypothetical protein